MAPDADLGTGNISANRDPIPRRAHILEVRETDNKINQKHLEVERDSTMEKAKSGKVAREGHCNFNSGQGRPEGER